MYKEIGLTILHPSVNSFTEVFANGLTFHQMVRKYWDGTIIGVGNLHPAAASQVIAEGTIDLAAFGRPLLANPNFIQQIKNRTMLETYDASLHLKHLY